MRHAARERTGRRAGLAGTRRSGRAPATASGRGQSLVEFALVIPLFLTMLIAPVEFAFAFNAVLATAVAFWKYWLAGSIR